MNIIERVLVASEAERRELVRQQLIAGVTGQIRAAMQTAGVNKAELAEKLTISKSSVTQLLSGQRNMTLATLSDIADAIGLAVSITLTEQEPTKTEARAKAAN